MMNKREQFIFGISIIWLMFLSFLLVIALYYEIYFTVFTTIICIILMICGLIKNYKGLFE
jgi:hypothetical protein